MAIKSEAEFLAMFRRHVEAAGGVRALARKLGLSAAYVSDVRLGRRSPGPSILKPLKLKRVVITRVEFHDQ